MPVLPQQPIGAWASAMASELRAAEPGHFAPPAWAPEPGHFAPHLGRLSPGTLPPGMDPQAWAVRPSSEAAEPGCFTPWPGQPSPLPARLPKTDLEKCASWAVCLCLQKLTLCSPNRGKFEFFPCCCSVLWTVGQFASSCMIRNTWGTLMRTFPFSCACFIYCFNKKQLQAFKLLGFFL